MQRTEAGSRATRTLIALLAAVAAWVVPLGTAEAAINSGASALQVAQAMMTNPSIVTGASFVAKPPNGAPTAVADTGSAMGGFPLNGTTYAILSTGNAADADNAPQSNFASTDLGGGNIRGNTDLDVTILKVDVNVPPTANCATVGAFKFLSEEYPTYVGGIFNDAFIAELDSSTWTTSGSTISAPNNFAKDASGSVVSINSSGATGMTSANAAGTVYGGATATLYASVPVTSGPHSFYFSIFDQGDHVYDSTVFLDNFTLSNAPPGGCTTGAKASLVTKKTADVPYACLHTVNGYTITISNPNPTAVQLNNITDDLPAGFSYRTGTTTGVTTLDPAITGQHLQWNGPFTVPANGQMSLHFEVHTANQAGVYYNDAGGDAGSVTVTPAKGTAPITVYYEGTILTARPAVADVSLTPYASVFLLRARLTFAGTGDPIQGQEVKFYAGSTFLGSALTDFDGVAAFQSIGHAREIIDEPGYTAVYDGSACYQPSSDDAPVALVLGNQVP